jgi:hypothetical protein
MCAPPGHCHDRYIPLPPLTLTHSYAYSYSYSIPKIVTGPQHWNDTAPELSPRLLLPFPCLPFPSWWALAGIPCLSGGRRRRRRRRGSFCLLAHLLAHSHNFGAAQPHFRAQTPTPTALRALDPTVPPLFSLVYLMDVGVAWIKISLNLWALALTCAWF